MKKRKNAGNEGIKRAEAGELRMVGWSFWGCRDHSDGDGSDQNFQQRPWSAQVSFANLLWET